MDKCTFGVHEVKLVVKTSPSLSNGSGVGQTCRRHVGPWRGHHRAQQWEVGS